MRQQWGREGYAGKWPSEAPIWMIVALAVAVLSAAAIGYGCYIWRMTPLQRYYLEAYVGAQFAGAMRDEGRYTLIEIENARTRSLALDDEVTPVLTSDGRTGFALTDEARSRGALRLVIRREIYRNIALHQLLKQWIYDHQTVTDLFKPSLYGGLAVFVFALIATSRKAAQRSREVKEGRRLKGPELVTARQFNRRARADGIGFHLVPTISEMLCKRDAVLRIPQHRESSHFLLMGDTGAGKGVLIRDLLRQIRARGHSAIVYDPALEYVPQFFNPSRGDLILNPLDQRMPFWTLGDEMRSEAEALTLAASLFPERQVENRFFVEGPRKIFAHLLTFRPTPEELVAWMAHPKEIDRRVAGTEYAAMIDPEAPAQRNGILGSLNMVADAFKTLPRESETTERWSTLAWSKEPHGFLFLTSTPETREKLLPLTSLWLDTLVLRMMYRGMLEEEPDVQPVWFILDELASLQRLPQLHTVITENRKSNNPVVLSFQGRSQLEALYGRQAEVMFSQPATKIFLRTSEPNAARWISEAIGEIEVERKRETRSSGEFPQQQRRSKSFTLGREREPLVMASEITGLADLQGYFKHGNLVVRMAIPYTEPRKRCKPFIPRTTDQWPRKLPNLPPSVAADVKDATAGQQLTLHEQQQGQQQAVRRATSQSRKRYFE